MTILRSAFLCLVLLSLCLTAFSECDQCQFTDDDAADCKVYGKIDDRLVAWHRASADCLDNYNIKKASIEPDVVGCEPVDASKFVDTLGFDYIPNFVLGGLGVAEGGFFEEQEAGGRLELKDEITVNGQTYNCVANKNDCNDAMKSYFASSPGSNEMMEVCGPIINQYFEDRDLEQGFSRNRICSDIKANEDLPTVCGDLVNQMVTEVADNPNKFCSGFQKGTANTVIPGCEDDTPGDSSRAPRASFTCSSLLVVAILLLVNVC